MSTVSFVINEPIGPRTIEAEHDRLNGMFPNGYRVIRQDLRMVGGRFTDVLRVVPNGLSDDQSVDVFFDVSPAFAQSRNQLLQSLAFPAGEVTASTDNALPMAARIALSAALTAAVGASVYHGYKRNDSLGWGLWWGLMGALFPVITVPVALAQGFAEPRQ